MKLLYALSVRQPWAWGIFNAGKDVENRSWITHYRGPLLIHATARSTKADFYWFQSVYPNEIPETVGGAIIGIVHLVDVAQRHHSVWSQPGHYHWVLENPREFDKPVFCCGRQKLWVPDEQTMKMVGNELKKGRNR